MRYAIIGIMENKITKLRNYILDLLESGTLKEGDKLPGARRISSEIGVSFSKVQQGIEKLVQDGVLETVLRQGTFVQKGWHERILQANFCTFKHLKGLPWLKKLTDIFAKRLPQMRIASEFENGIFELRTTLMLQSNRDEYMDLSEIFDKCYQDKSIFFKHPFKTFYIDGKLFGIPFIFSPRVMLYNPKLLKQGDCEEPKLGWTWYDFINCVKKLKKTVPHENIFNWHSGAHLWINFIFRAGGALFDFDADDPVAIDHPKTQYGLQLFTDLKNELGIERINDDNSKSFLNGETVFMVAPREFLPQIIAAGLKEWNAVPLPLIEGGSDITAQATDLICIRKDCVDNRMAEEFVMTMLSEEVQDFIAAEKYGIPIRKSSAFKSIDLEDPRDTLFLSESSKISAQYNIDSPELSKLIQDGIRQIWANGNNVKKTTTELASAVRILLKIKQQEKDNITQKEVLG
jgi:ABC-type glycerol-3-phosphate transport system substrate-binding protein